MSTADKRRSEQLGMNYSTAMGRLRKTLLFQLAKECNKDICYRCQKRILSEGELSIDHKVPWSGSDRPSGLFFDENNIAFSHLSCNSHHGRTLIKTIPCPSFASYRRGCRCEGCRKANADYHRKFRQ